MIFFIALSALLITLDYHHYLPSLRRLLNNAVAPLQYAIDAPFRLVHELAQAVVTRKALQWENTRLQVQQLLFEAKLQRFDALENENKHLNQLLNVSTHLKKQRVKVAHLLYVNTDPQWNEVIVDKGQSDGAYVGQPVIDADGIMGQVISVDLLTSRVLLITDFRSAIPVQDVRSDARGILVGRGRWAKLLLKDIPGTIDVKVNDLLVSSGLGGHYPPGYPVGLVTAVYADAATQFSSIHVEPSAQLNLHRPILLVWSDTIAPSAKKPTQRPSSIKAGHS